jgi:hypothetical protein
MGMTIMLETESGEVLESTDDAANALHRVLPKHDDPSCYYVNCIDWYGDTMFNVLQVPRFLSEWNRLLPTAQQHGAAALHAKIDAMARRCQVEVHVYLKFRGD